MLFLRGRVNSMVDSIVGKIDKSLHEFEKSRHQPLALSIYDTESSRRKNADSIPLKYVFSHLT